MIIGVDASNIRGGGGFTHLFELLRVVEPEEYNIARVIVWGGKKTLAALEDYPWLEKVSPPIFDKGLLERAYWQRFKLSGVAKALGCDVLFVPGGTYAGSFRPFVTMNQNLLPFEWGEMQRYGWSLTTLRLLLLRWTQSSSFRRADGVIFLTGHAKNSVIKVTGQLNGLTQIIPHGLNPRFMREPGAQWPNSNYSEVRPCRLLYVSIIDQYKHQWNVVEAVEILRNESFPLTLDLIGPAYPPALMRLNEAIARLDPERSWVHYHGAIPFNELHLQYERADIGVFASTCETFGIILLETMAAGLPIACSDRGAMQEILGEAGVYFDPENPYDIADALRQLIKSSELREQKAHAAFKRAKEFSWERCADETLCFLGKVVAENHCNNEPMS
ncbi:MAG: glycosyltransferase family 4 protein [Chlorobiales bacterium]|nr:glycosyltransferase family 4 protein [Chlorobiales bacterium]